MSSETKALLYNNPFFVFSLCGVFFAANKILLSAPTPFFNVLSISAQVFEITSHVVSKCIPHTRFETFNFCRFCPGAGRALRQAAELQHAGPDSDQR